MLVPATRLFFATLFLQLSWLLSGLFSTSLTQGSLCAQEAISPESTIRLRYQKSEHLIPLQVHVGGDVSASHSSPRTQKVTDGLR